MPFDWQHYLTLADRLAQGADEAEFRSAVSRAYYAALHKARQHKDDHLGAYAPDRELGSHDAVWDFYRRHRNPNYSRIGEWASRLKAARVLADYNEDVDIDSQKAKDSCATAARLIQRLAHL